MVRFNMILLLIAVVCALGVVTSQHRARKLFQDLEGEQERVRKLDIEYGQLQLELSTWATHPRIEKIARDRLHMVTPDAVGKVVDKPVVVTPVVSLNEKGSLVVNVANGDQEELGSATVNDNHVVWSVTEVAGATRSVPQLNWYLQMNSGERVTGPMAVFDKALYFATYRPNSTANVCAPGEARLYGVDFMKPELGDVTKGGAYRMPAMPNPVQFVVDSDPTVAEKLLPGVTVRASQACATDQSSYDYFGGGPRNTPNVTSPVSYSLVANVSAPDTGPGKNSVKQIKKDLALPVTQTVVDAWASVVE